VNFVSNILEELPTIYLLPKSLLRPGGGMRDFAPFFCYAIDQAVYRRLFPLFVVCWHHFSHLSCSFQSPSATF